MRAADLCDHVTPVSFIPNVDAVLEAKILDTGPSNVANIGDGRLIYSVPYTIVL